jgi:lipid-binding SYLF domain-containing protein
MKQALRVLLIVALVCSLPAFADDKDNDSSSSKQSDSEAVQRLNEAADDLNRLTNAPDNNIPQSILADAKCVAIVPKLVKGGFIVGAEHGRGVATCRTEKGVWSAPAFFAISGGSFGAQIGVEGVDLVLLFMNKEGADKLLSAEWKIGADAGIAAGPWGRDASANAAVNMSTGIFTYSRGRGAFIGADLDGANVHADEDAIRSFYGESYNFRDLLEGRVAPPAAAHEFLHQIRHDFHEAREEH